jgi:hypothetical protein
MFFHELFTFSYLSLTVTGLPTYHNRSADFKFKMAEIEAVIKMEGQKVTVKKTKRILEKTFCQRGVVGCAF